ncbi:MAG: hypothetical protein AABY22_33080 [Nanoarchaeota archaeon]
MNIYNITKGQLIVMWLGGFIITTMTIDAEPFGGIMSFITIIIDTAIVMYTLGWRSYRKNKS